MYHGQKCSSCDFYLLLVCPIYHNFVAKSGIRLRVNLRFRFRLRFRHRFRLRFTHLKLSDSIDAHRSDYHVPRDLNKIVTEFICNLFYKV